jgi:hypothetical protein
MNKMTIVINDYVSNFKSLVTYNEHDIIAIEKKTRDNEHHLQQWQVLPEFEGYTQWCELTPNHYRFLIARMLVELDKLEQSERMNSKHPEVAMTNFIIAAFVMRLEALTCSEIEHFRINRFDDTSVTYDYTGTFEMHHERPEGKPDDRKPAFSIIVDNTL